MFSPSTNKMDRTIMYVLSMAMERELALRTEATVLGKKLDCEVKDNADAVKAAKSRPTKDFMMMLI